MEKREVKKAFETVKKESPELFQGFGCLGAIAVVTIIFTLVFWSKFFLVITLTTAFGMYVVFWTIKSKVKALLSQSKTSAGERMKFNQIQELVDELGEDKQLISDGSHTFQELYFHRMILFATILRLNPDVSFKSKKHADGTMFDGYFICGIETPGGMYTYHYPLEQWEYFDSIKELELAPEWDGHMPKDVMRLLSL